jgi:hypothetical protein
MLYCWRCDAEVPMLDEAEFAIVSQAYADCMASLKDMRVRERIGLAEAPINALFRPVREAYAALTGWEDMHENAIAHHRIATYGPPCRQCGKPLRTPRARLCIVCGAAVEMGGHYEREEGR